LLAKPEIVMDTSPQEYKTHLQNIYHVTEEEYQKLLPYLTVKSFKKDEFVLFQGDVCNHLFYVEKGLLRSYSIDDSGKEHIIQFAPEGWFMGDRSNFLFKQPSEYFIQAIEDTRVILLSQEFNDKAEELSANYRHYNNFALHKHISQLQNRITMLMSFNAEKRYLHFIETYFNLTLRVPQWMIASYLGITPEGLSRVRKELARKNF